MDAKSISAKNNGQAGTHNSPEDRDNQASPMTTTGEKRWKQTQQRTGAPNNLASEEPEGPMVKPRTGSTVSTTSAMNTGGKM